MKIVKVEAGWVVLGGAGAVLATHSTREQARAWVRAQKSTSAIDVVVNTTRPTTFARPALPFAPSRYVGRTSLGLVLLSALPFDAFMGRPALGPGRCYNLDLEPLRPRYRVT